MSYLIFDTPSFGYGLSYTDFEYSDFSTDKREYSKEEVIEVTFQLNNNGDYDGVEVVQLYFCDPFAQITRPVLSLVAFDRINLLKGEKKVCSFSIPVSSFKYWNGKEWTLDAGEIELFVGGNSESLLKTVVSIN